MNLATFVTAFAALFAIMNPFVALPMFLSLTDGYAPPAQRRAGLRAAGYSAILAAIVLVAGSAVLGFFSINVNDFRIAGGIVLLMIGLNMLNGTGSTAHSGTPAEQEHHAELNDVSFYPMAFPMIVGPGTITTLVLLTGNGTMTSYLSVAAALAVVIVLLAVVLYFSTSIGHLLSQKLRVIMTRLMGMILAAIAVQMIVAGLLTVFPGLG
jgi:multiple antibiotic resistance protein